VVYTQLSLNSQNQKEGLFHSYNYSTIWASIHFCPSYCYHRLIRFWSTIIEVVSILHDYTLKSLFQLNEIMQSKEIFTCDLIETPFAMTQFFKTAYFSILTRFLIIGFLLKAPCPIL
jgi:hypothetical protein